MTPITLLFSFFFFNDTAPTEIYPLSLPDALPICPVAGRGGPLEDEAALADGDPGNGGIGEPGSPSASAASSSRDRKSTRLNSSHLGISYAVFCLKKKKQYSRRRALQRCDQLR